MRKAAVVLLFGAILLVITTPLGLYFLGLSNVEGRPTPPILTSNVVADSIELQGVLRTKTHIVVHPSNPWIVVAPFRSGPSPPTATGREDSFRAGAGPTAHSVRTIDQSIDAMQPKS